MEKSSWPCIQNTVEEKLNVTFKIKYNKRDTKLNTLRQEQIKTLHTRESFYPRAINKTDITFSNKQISLLYICVWTCYLYNFY